VNLGGWLVLEPWITPKFFEEVNVGDNEGLVVDEWTYAQYVDPVIGMERKIKYDNLT
jgi:glucan 1,3-beta-glucosidase